MMIDEPIFLRLIHSLPLSLRPYLALMRLDRPIGIWLLMWPCLWALTLASNVFPNLWLTGHFIVGSIIMRGAGCVINDIYDRDLDQKVERTRLRPLANGEVQLWQAILFVILLLLLGLGILLTLNRLTIIIGFCSLILVFLYPLMKRFTWWPQLFLGLTFNIGSLMGWSAVKGHLSLSVFLLYGAGIFWTLGYDTIYAYQDLQDDAYANIKSTARLFTKHARPWVGAFYGISFVFLLFAGWSQNEKLGFYGIMTILVGITCFQLVAWRWDAPADCLRRFRNNSEFGFIVFLAFLCGKWF